MEPALKQRLIGAAVLVALAVIFLPMLIKGPAPESGASNVPLDLPEAPQGQFETRELPLVTPGQTPSTGAVGMQSADATEQLPTVDTADSAPTESATDASMQPAATAGGDYAVSFGSYATASDADRVVAALKTAQLPGYQESATVNGSRSVYRVRIGPYATRADAETARLKATHVRDDVGAKVVTLDADATTSQPAAATPTVSKPIAAPESKPVATKPLSEDAIKATASAETKPAPTKPAEPTKPVVAPAKATVAAAKPVIAPAKPAAANVGFAVQLGAFASADEANKLRERARAAGFSAFVEAVRTDKGTLNRVRVGPVSTRAEGDALKAKVAAKLGVDGIVRPHP